MIAFPQRVPFPALLVAFTLLTQTDSGGQAAERPTHDYGLIKTTASPHAKLRSVDLGAVQWTSGFWADRFATAESTSLPRLWELAQPYAWRNLRIAAGLEEGKVRGCDWQDAWIYKWIESACYVYSQSRDGTLLEKIDVAVDVIAKAQEPDGYIATQTTLRGIDRFDNYRHHEMYTMGHLITAACIHHRMTGKTNLLDVARKAADYLHGAYRENANPYLVNCPYNPSIIMAAVELYRTTGEPRYLELANIVIDNRGKKRPRVPRDEFGHVRGNTDLNQDRVPLREAKEVVGHSVFWSYLYAGAADAYLETGDSTLFEALERLWLDLTQTKMFITGGVSPVHKGLPSQVGKPGTRYFLNDEIHEGVGLPYDLPSATSHNETCGQIGNLMWNWRMLAITGEARFADVMEQSIYNAILSGVNLSGEGWSYSNPLRWYGPEHECLPGDFHQRISPGERRICCPTNVLRTVASWHGCLYGTSNEGLWVHHYGASKARIDLLEGYVQLTQTTDYPWDGRVRLVFDEVTVKQPFAVRLRIPGWAEGAKLMVNGVAVEKEFSPASYANVERRWTSRDTVELTLPMPVRMVIAHPRLEQARNQVAVMRGPVVYCLESIDLPDGIVFEHVHLPRGAEWTVHHEPDLLRGVTVLETEAVVVPGHDGSTKLYQELPDADVQEIVVRLIPYYAWNNRGEPKMSVWLPLN